jgi:hypothetical protein
MDADKARVDAFLTEGLEGVSTVAVVSKIGYQA